MTQPAIDRLSTLSALTSELVSLHSLDLLVTQGLPRIQSAFNIDHVALYLANPAGNGLALRAATKGKKVIPYQEPVAENANTPVALASQQRHFFTTIGERPFSHALYPAAQVELALPLVQDDTLYGLLCLQSRNTDLLNPEQIPNLQTVADHFAAALAHTYRYARQTTRADRLAEVQDFAIKLNEIRYDRNAVFAAVCKFGRDLLKADDVGIWLPVADNPAKIELVVTERGDGKDLTGRRAAVGEGLSGFVFQSGELLYVDNYAEWPGRLPTFGDAPMRAALAAPMLWLGKTVGVLTLANTQQTRAFSDDDQRIAELLAAQAAGAIEHASLMAETRERVDELSILNRLSEALAGETDPQRLYNLVAEEVGAFFDAKNLYIALYDAETNLINIPYLKEVEELVVVPPFEMGPGLTSHIIRTRQPLRIVENAAQQMEKLNVMLAGRTDLPLSFLGVPMVVKGEVLGVIAVQDFDHSLLYSESDAQLLATIARQVGLALQNTRLLSQTEERAQRLRAIVELGQSTANIQSPDQLFSQVANLIQSTFDLYYVGIFIVDADQTWANLVAGTGEAGQRQLARNHRLSVGGESMIGQATRTGAPRIALDVGQEAVRFENPDLPATRSELALPLHTRTGVIGALTIQSERPGAFTAQDVEVFQLLADQLGTAVANTRLYDQTQRQFNELSAVSRVGQRIAASLQLADILNGILDEALSLTNSNYGTIALYNPDTRSMTVQAARGFDPQRTSELINTHLLADEPSLHARVMATGEAFVIGDVTEIPDYYAWAPGVRSELIAPIQQGETLVGAINLESQQVQGFNEDTKRLVLALADQTAVAVQNARLYESQQRRAGELAVVNSLIAEVSAKLDLQEALTTTCRTLSETFNAPQSGAALLQPDGQSLILLAEFKPATQPSVIGVEIGIENNLITQEVLATAQPVVVANAQTDPRMAPVHDLMRHRGVVTLCLLPLIIRGEVIGTIGLDNLTARTYTDEDLQLAMSMVNATAQAIDNARLFQAEQAQRESASALLNILTVATSTLDPRLLLFEFAQRSAQALKAQRATIYLLNEDGSTLQPVASQFANPDQTDAELWERFSQAVVPVGNAPLLDRLLAAPLPLVLTDFSESSDLPAAWLPFTQDISILLVVPLVSRDSVIGLLGIDDDNPNRSFTPEEIDLATSIGRQVAIAIENARLASQTEIALAETEELYAASSRLVTANSLEAVLHALIYSTPLKQLNRANLLFFDKIWSDLPPQSLTLGAVWERSGLPIETPIGTTFALDTYPMLRQMNRNNSLVVRDILEQETDPAVRKAMRDIDMRGIVFFPLVSAGEWYGILAGQSQQPLALTDAELRRIRSLTDQAATVVQNLRLYQQTQSALSETRALYDGSSRLRSAGQDEQAMLAAVVESVPLLPINRAHMIELEFHTEGFPMAMNIVANWFSGRGQPPISVGVRYGAERASVLMLVNRETPLIVPDINDKDTPLDQEAKAFFQEQGTTALIVVPLRLTERQMGVLLLEGDEAYPFDPRELQPIFTLAGEFTLIYTNYQLLRESQRAYRETNALLQVSRQVGSLNLEEVMHSVLQSTIDAVSPADVGMIVLHDLRNRQLYIESALGYPNARGLEGRVLDIGKSIAGEVFRSQQPRRFNVTDLIDTPRSPSGYQSARPTRTNDRQDQVISQLAVPIQRSGVSLGVLMLGSRQRPNAFSDSDVALIESLASQMAVAIENARLFSQTQQLARRQQLINEITARIRRAGSTDGVLNTTLSELQQALGARTARGRLVTNRQLNNPPSDNGQPTEEAPA